MELIVGVHLRDQSLPFMFEVMDPASGLPEVTYILPFNPEVYKFSGTPRASETLTQGGVFEDRIGLAPPKMFMTGTFGYRGTLPGGTGRHIKGEEKDSWALYQEIENTFLTFYERFGTTGQDGQKVARPVNPLNPPELRFYNYTDKHYYQVQLKKFEVTRNIQRRHLYQYEIAMSGLRRLNQATYEEDYLAAMFAEPAEPMDLGVWGQVLRGYTSLSNKMSDVVSKVQEIQGKLSTIKAAVAGFRQGISDVIAAPFSLVRSALETIDSVISTVASIENLPQEFICELRETKRSLLQLTFHEDKFTVSSVAGSTDDVSGRQEILTTQLPQMSSVRGLVVEMDNPETTLFAPGHEVTKKLAAKEEAIQDNDTMESLAYRVLGTAREWQQLAVMNDLEYPYIATGLDRFSPTKETGSLVSVNGRELRLDGITPLAGEVLVLEDESVVVESVGDGTAVVSTFLQSEHAAGTEVTLHERELSVLKPGDKIKVPGEAPAAVSIAVGSNQEFAAQLYGEDEYLDDTGDHGEGAGGDIGTVAGIDNLVMQLRHRLMTVPGELAAVGHPKYGSYLPLIIGKISTDFWLERALLEAEKTILADRRIATVKNLKFVVDNTAIYIEAAVVPVGSLSGQTLRVLVV